MAVLIDSFTKNLTRNTNVTAMNSPYSGCCWMRFISLSAIRTIWSIGRNNNSTDAMDLIGANATGSVLSTRVYVASATTVNGSTTLSADTWYHVGWSRESNTALNVYLNGVLELTNTANITGRSAQTREIWGAATTGGGERWNGRLAAFKEWDVALTADEMKLEMATILPARMADLRAFTPAFAGSGERARDYSANKFNWTETGTITDEDGPPVPWSLPPMDMPYAIAVAPPATQRGYMTPMTRMWG